MGTDMRCTPSCCAGGAADAAEPQWEQHTQRLAQGPTATALARSCTVAESITASSLGRARPRLKDHSCFRLVPRRASQTRGRMARQPCVLPAHRQQPGSLAGPPYSRKPHSHRCRSRPTKEAAGLTDSPRRPGG